jgi:outer membrane protein OmpA-like peptidoglycan-associated protein
MGIASAAGAEKFAPDVFAKARQELEQARNLQSGKGNDDLIVQHARAATEIAEDSRIIAERHQQEAALIAARQDTVDAQTARLKAEARAERESERADNAQAQALAEREARQRAEAEARIAREQAAQATVIEVQPAPAAPQPAPPMKQDDTAAKDLRRQVLQRLNMAIVTRDTPRGLDATLNDPDFDHGELRAGPANAVARMASILALHPDLRIAVEGNSDTPEGSELARRRAQSVAAALTAAGIPAQRISCEGLANSRPVVSNAPEQGRTENRRVEIVITGDAIGTVPSWDRTYPLSFGQR